MNGADIVASVAHRRQVALIGRAYLYELMAGDRQGVDPTTAILRSEIERTLALGEQHRPRSIESIAPAAQWGQLNGGSDAPERKTAWPH
jgi:isopentenyl diphosphate isomerase/L-lactate dehydrogenase-like FMN-dependent dehydrogenase